VTENRGDRDNRDNQGDRDHRNSRNDAAGGARRNARWRRWGQAAAWLALRGLGRIAPGLAAPGWERLVLTPRRHQRPDWEQARLESAQRCDFYSPARRAWLAAWRWGGADDPARPAVLLVHGWAGRGSQLSAFAEPLLAAGLQPVAMDAMGHGDSPRGPASLADLAREIMDFQAALGRPLRGVIGHSMGGTSAAVAAHLGAEIARLVLVGAPANPFTFLAEAKRRLGLSGREMQALYERLYRRTGIPLAATDILAFGRDLGDRPALVIQDRADRAVRFATAERIIQSWPGARLMATEGLGHHRILRDPQVTAAAAHFLAEPPPVG